MFLSNRLLTYRDSTIWRLKWLLHGFIMIGLLLVLADLTGATLDDDRIVFAKSVVESRDHGVKPDGPGARKFLKRFLPADKKNKQVRSISVTRLQSSGGTTFGGVARIVFDDLTQIDACSFEELTTWSQETWLWKWVGWILAFAGWLLAIAVDALQRFGYRVIA